MNITGQGLSEADSEVEAQTNIANQKLAAKKLYQPMKPWQTRLICLKKAGSNLPFAPLDINLVTADLVALDSGAVINGNDLVEYEALSYAWGFNNPSTTVICNGLIYPITQHLATALEDLRRVDEDRYLWIDALCINQHDQTGEKSAQVREMLTIYFKAKRVLVWLGPSSRSFNETTRCKGCEDPNWCQEHLSATRTILLESEWFQRTWVRQEVYAAREILVIFFGFEVPWDSFLSMTSYDQATKPSTTSDAKGSGNSQIGHSADVTEIKSKSTVLLDMSEESSSPALDTIDSSSITKPLRPRSKDAIDSALPTSVIVARRKNLKILDFTYRHLCEELQSQMQKATVHGPKWFLNRKRRKISIRDADGLLSLLQLGESFAATESKDHIYSVLGMLKKDKHRFRGHFPIDYGKSFHQVCSDVTKYIIRETNSLKILELCPAWGRESHAIDWSTGFGRDVEIQSSGPLEQCGWLDDLNLTVPVNDEFIRFPALTREDELHSIYPANSQPLLLPGKIHGVLRDAHGTEISTHFEGTKRNGFKHFFLVDEGFNESQRLNDSDGLNDHQKTVRFLLLEPKGHSRSDIEYESSAKSGDLFAYLEPGSLRCLLRRTPSVQELYEIIHVDGIYPMVRIAEEDRTGDDTPSYQSDPALSLYYKEPTGPLRLEEYKIFPIR